MRKRFKNNQPEIDAEQALQHLRNAFARVCVAGYGIDNELDSQLSKLRHALNHDEAIDSIREQSKIIANTLIRIDEERNKKQAQEAGDSTKTASWWQAVVSKFKVSSDNSDKILKEIKLELTDLIKHLDLPIDKSKANDLSLNLEQSETIDDLLKLFSELKILINQAHSIEKQKYENFLSHLNKQLDSVYRFIAKTQKNALATQDNTQQLNDNVRDQLAGIQESVNTETEIESLQQAVNQRLQVIHDEMDHHRDAETARLQETLETINNMNARLKETEETSKALESALDEERHSAQRDPLTQLANRAAYDKKIRDEFDRWQRQRDNLSLILADIDFFKNINDTYGHIAGDRILKAVGKLFNGAIRSTDFVARYGGEEFALLSHATSADQAKVLAEKLREQCENCKFHHSGKQVKLTMSFGIAEFTENDTPETVFERADKALYQAKEQGRNQVVCHTLDLNQQNHALD